MGTWKNRGLRGSVLEEYINYSNERYREKGLALIQKIPTPITPIEINKNTKHITLAYFEKKSTVDYIGAVQNIPVCFDAKECAKTNFSLANVHEHQLQFMQDFEKQGGVAFLIIYFKSLDRIIYVSLKDLLPFFERMKNGGRKSFEFEELDEEYLIPRQGDIVVHYLHSLGVYLSRC